MGALRECDRVTDTLRRTKTQNVMKTAERLL